MKIVPIFASNYNLNIMLRIQEICKERGMTMQELAAQIGITYQALYACASGNPTIGKLKIIASALDVDVADLFEREKEEDKNIISCPHCGGKIHFDGEPRMPDHKNIRGKEYFK